MHETDYQRNSEVFNQWWAQVPKTELAKRFGISDGAIGRIIMREIIRRRLPRPSLTKQLRNSLGGSPVAPRNKSELRTIVFEEMCKKYELHD